MPSKQKKNFRQHEFEEKVRQQFIWARGIKVATCAFLGVFVYVIMMIFRGFAYLGKGLWRGIKYYCYNLFFQVVKLIARPFLRAKVVGKKNILKSDSARVFVANHLEVYGPVLAYLHLPVHKKRFWIIDKMLDPNLAEQQMRYAVEDPNNFKWAPMWLRKLAVKALKGVASFVLVHKVKGISISRDNARQMLQTFKTSVSAMENGYNIVLFPEVQYQDRGFGEVYDSFVMLGKYYYKKTNKLLSFYPVYIDKFSKKINIGKPIKFNPETPNDVSTIVNYISTTINNFAQNENANR